MNVFPIYSRDYCSNTFLLASGSECAIIDPGQNMSVIETALKESSLTPKMIILTHGHFDHIFSVDKLREKYGIPLLVHRDDAEMLSDTNKNAYSFFFGGKLSLGDADRVFSDGDVIKIGDEELKVIHTPGHTRGSSCFICGDIMITGDTLFSAGIGRTDLYGGDMKTLFESLSKMRNIERGGEITIYPGHGGRTLLSHALDNTIY